MQKARKQEGYKARRLAGKKARKTKTQTNLWFAGSRTVRKILPQVTLAMMLSCFDNDQGRE
jgi:hypothetical protein